MGDVLHLRHDTSPATRLDEIEVEVFRAVDRMCLEVGRLMFEARAIEGPRFRQWVDERMPFGYDKAKRLIAIHLAYSELPPETQAQLPRPWQALYALRHWAGGRLDQAIASGEVGASTTVAQAKERARKWSSDSKPPERFLSERHSRCDVIAGQLMAFSPDELNPDVLRALRRWVDR